MKVALMTSSLILERLFMLAAQYLPEDTDNDVVYKLCTPTDISFQQKYKSHR